MHRPPDPLRHLAGRVARHDALAFHLTNRLPRRLASRAMGWFAAIEHPWVAAVSIRALAVFAGDLRLDEARESSFRSLRDCFTRALKPGARPIDQTPGIIVSPSDGLVMASGAIDDETLVQAKGQTYTLSDLLVDDTLAAGYRHGSFVTLRLTAAMYHRFHAPCAGHIASVRLVPGDRWNVNPPTVTRVARLYCRNTRAIVPLTAADGTGTVTLVAVGAILVSSIRLAFLGHAPLSPGVRRCHVDVGRGEELGHFEHGSTIVVLAPRGWILADHVTEHAVLRVGQPLWRVPAAPEPARAGCLATPSRQLRP